MIKLDNWKRRLPALYYSIIGLFLILYSFLMIRAELNRGPTIQQLEGNRFLIKTPGYNDTISFSVKRDSSGAYTDFELLESRESPLYASVEHIAEYFSRLEGLGPEELDEVDGITGATTTSEAICNALQGLEQSALTKWKQMALFTFLWGLVVLLSVLKKGRLLFLLSCLCFLLIGVIYNAPVEIYALLSPTGSFHLLPLFALISVFLYRNVYCSHICPFGFLQRLARLIPLKKRFPLPAVLRTGKYILLAIAAASLLMGNRLYLEPYAYLFSRRPVWWIYLLPLAMLAVSLFIPRFWCRGFCPLGAAMQIGRGIRSSFLRGEPPHLSITASPQKSAVWLPLLPFGLILLSNVLLYLIF